jgi:hypothetical protein
MSHRYLISYQSSGIVSNMEVARHIDAPELLKARCRNMGESAKLVCPRTYKTLATCSPAGGFQWLDQSLTRAVA